MPLGKEDSDKLSLKEWALYHLHRDWHLAQYAKYDAGCPPRPTRDTAEDIWDRLAPELNFRLESLLPSLYPLLNEEEQHEVTLTVKQALVVALDCAAQVGRHPYVAWRDRTGQLRARTVMVTKNRLFDTLAARWSDHYRLARKERRASRIRDMRRETVRAARRDLLRSGISFGALWEALVGPNPLYTATRLEGSGYVVQLNEDSEALIEFEQLTQKDPHYRPDRLGQRLLFEHEALPKRVVRQEIAAERPYDVVQLGERSKRLITTLEETRLLFDAETFQADMRALEADARRIRQELWERRQFDADLSNWMPPTRRRNRARKQARQRQPVSKRERALRQRPAEQRQAIEPLLAQYDRARTTLALWGPVHKQLRALSKRVRLPDAPGYVPIKSGFYRVINRRYEPTHAWYSNTAAEWRDRWFGVAEEDALVMGPGDAEPSILEKGSITPLYGLDTSSSVTQIVAVLLGLGELEEVACSRPPAPPFNTYLAEQARAAGYGQGATDGQLREAVKDLWMRVLYGSRVRQVVLDHAKDRATYGPYWPSHSAEAFLDSLPWFKDIRKFLGACRRIAEVAYKRDRYQGVVFTDPYDLVEVRWNPVARADRPVSSSGHRLLLSLPQGKPNAAGDYPVRKGELERMVAPCLVHMLDAYFAGLVIERMKEAGVCNVVVAHDCWYVAAYGETTFDDLLWKLDDCIYRAGEEWLRGLGPVYERLVWYLGGNRQFGAFVRDARVRWKRRVQAKQWPRFAVKEARIT